MVKEGFLPRGILSRHDGDLTCFFPGYRRGKFLAKAAVGRYRKHSGFIQDVLDGAPAFSAMEMPDMTPENWRASISPDLNLLIISAPGLLSDNWNPPAAWSKPEVEARTFLGGRAPPGAVRVFLH